MPSPWPGRRALLIALTTLTVSATAAPMALASGGLGEGAGGASSTTSTDSQSHGHQGLVLRGPAQGAPVVNAQLAAPRTQVSLPAALDARPTYQAGVSCDPVDRPGTVQLGQLLMDTYRTGRYGVSRFCNGTTSEHHEGRALDWMLDAANPEHAAVADAWLGWLTADQGAMARRLGVQYVIWNRQMWRAYAPERGWVAYTGASPHTDHIHVSLTWDGAMGRTSYWTGRPVTTLDVGTCRVHAGQPAPLYTGVRTAPCPSATSAPSSTLPVVAIGSRDRVNVTRGQQALGITADGVFGRGTQQAVLAYQRSAGLPLTGALDHATWNRLVPASAVGTASAPMTTSAPSSTTATPTTTTAPAPTAPRAAPTTRVPAVVTRPLEAHKKTVLRPGARHASVRAAQQALGVRATGVMDRATVTAVKRVQARWKLRQTGVVDLRTWNRIELTRYPWLGYTNTTLRRGQSGAAVTALQRALRVGADGQFGPATQRAVQQVQGRYGLPTTGVVDAATWRAITHQAR
ncbi:MAG: peptidoglycan-binding domain-containing protein [Mobilicoccus sp.]|nr:peptidoglycan-binding domain-containing protein [Mobilicoccus sp.]